MKIFILICGLKRSIDLVLDKIGEKFLNHEIDIIICTNNDNDNDIFNNKNIIKKLFINDIHDDSFRNSLNYCKKIYDGLKLIDDNYDLYIVMRTDLIIKNLNLDDIQSNKLYFSNKNINQFTQNVLNRINDNIILTRNYDLLLKLIDLYDFTKNNTNYLDIVLYNFLNENNINYELIDIDYKLILSKCNIIAIAGDSGSGKSTLLKVLAPLFGNNILTLETDRYHKWERGDENYINYTHLNPYANYLEKMYEDVYDLKIGNEVYQVDYNHDTGKFTQKEKIEPKNNILVCGLHTLYENNIRDILDIKIYLDTDRELIKRWKIKRDVNERGYTFDKVIKQIENREKDYQEYICKQKENADIIIIFYEKNNKLECNLIIQNNYIINKILKELLELNYEIRYDNNNLVIKLKNDYYKEIYHIFYYLVK
jgi:uridine kinase